MAPQLSLVRLEDLGADIDSLDLLSGGFTPTNWVQAIANEDDSSVSEVITLKIEGSSQDNLSSLVQSLDNKIKQANWHSDLSERYGVWLRAKMGNESLARQAMVIKARRSPVVPLFDAPAGANNIARAYQLGLDRTPWWEYAYPYPSTTNITGLSTLGGASTLAETIRGDVNARLVRLTISPVGDAVLGKFWLGWKTNRFGSSANFVPVWPVRLGDESTDTSATADATAYDGNRITCTFATDATLVRRSLIFVGQVTANYQDQRGGYSVLMRAKMSDASVARARISHAYNVNVAQTLNSRQVISGTNWKLYEMGDVFIPSPKGLSGLSLYNYTIQLEAERVSGSGDLHVDCYVFIPVDDASVRVDTETNLSSTNTLRVYQKADERVEALAMTGDILVIHSPNVSSRGWSLPSNDSSPVLIFAAQSTATQDKDWTADLTYTYTPRWATLRGSET